MFDLTNTASFDALKDWLYDFTQNCSSQSYPGNESVRDSLGRITFCVLANKLDLVNQDTLEGAE